MVHPDYQYTPQLIPAMVALIGNGLYPCVLGSRILGGYALTGGMPLWKYVANRVPDAGREPPARREALRVPHRLPRVLARDPAGTLPLDGNSDDFVFDNQMLAQILWLGYTIAEVSCPTKYFPEASSINFRRSLRYGFGCLTTAATYRLARWQVVGSPLFPGRPLLMNRRLLLCVSLALGLLTAAFYWPVTGYEFIAFDDGIYVTANEQVQEGLTLEGARWALTTLRGSNWHPLTWFSHMVDVSLFGLVPGRIISRAFYFT